jgi:leucyl/phenylalanyl-tRNA--protein transferase
MTKRFDADALLACYARGVFPMADSRDDPRLFLVDPDRRGVLPLQGVHIPRRLARTLRAEPYEVRINTVFRRVVEACAAPGPGRENTWINDAVIDLYTQLYQRGQAHSVECWRGEALVGGLYGVSLGAAFFGESMFSAATDASKIALIHLVARLKIGGYTLLDTQFLTDHLQQFGTREIARADYKALLAEALGLHADFFQLPPTATGADVVRIASTG